MMDVYIAYHVDILNVANMYIAILFYALICILYLPIAYIITKSLMDDDKEKNNIKI